MEETNRLNELERLKMKALEEEEVARGYKIYRDTLAVYHNDKLEKSNSKKGGEIKLGEEYSMNTNSTIGSSNNTQSSSITSVPTATSATSTTFTSATNHTSAVHHSKHKNKIDPNSHQTQENMKRLMNIGKRIGVCVTLPKIESIEIKQLTVAADIVTDETDVNQLTPTNSVSYSKSKISKFQFDVGATGVGNGHTGIHGGGTNEHNHSNSNNNSPKHVNPNSTNHSTSHNNNNGTVATKRSFTNASPLLANNMNNIKVRGESKMESLANVVTVRVLWFNYFVQMHFMCYVLCRIK